MRRDGAPWRTSSGSRMRCESRCVHGCAQQHDRDRRGARSRWCCQSPCNSPAWTRARTTAPPSAAKSAAITSHIARLRTQAFEHQLGGEREQHDRDRQVGRGQHGEPGVHAAVDRRVGERDPRRQTGAGGDRQPVEQLASAAVTAPESQSRAAPWRSGAPPIRRSVIACAQLAASPGAGSTGSRVARTRRARPPRRARSPTTPRSVCVPRRPRPRCRPPGARPAMTSPSPTASVVEPRQNSERDRSEQPPPGSGCVRTHCGRRSPRRWRGNRSFPTAAHRNVPTSIGRFFKIP